MPFVPVHCAQHELAIPAYDEAIRLGLYPRRQHSRIHQIGEEDRQSPNLTWIIRRGQQILGLGVRAVNGQHLPGQSRRCRTITAVDRRNRAIQQLINRSPTFGAGFAVWR
jgi:hypothetical protein